MNVQFSESVPIAAVNRYDGTFYKGRGWDKLTPVQQKLVQLHEVGHFLMDSVDEKECDRFALVSYLIDKPGIADALREFVGALDSGNPAQVDRAQDLAEFAIYLDAKAGGKESAKLFKFLNPISGILGDDDFGLKDLLGGVTDLAKVFIPAPQQTQQPQQQQQQIPQQIMTAPKEESNTGLYIALGAGFLVLILAVVFLVIFMRK